MLADKNTNLEITVDGNAPEAGKTFTQDDVNRIVQERLAREKVKFEATLTQREQELNQREFQLNARQLLENKGLPASMLDALNASNQETFEKAITIIEEHLKTKNTTTPIPRIVLPANGNFGGGEDPVRRAMGLNRKE